MLPEISLLARLEEIDAQSHQIQSRLTELPKLVAQEKQAVAARKQALEKLEAAIAANDKERRQKEGDIQLRQTKLGKLRGQIEQAANDVQYQAFRHEIEFSESEIAANEDRVLALMMEFESLEPQVAQAKAELATAQKAGLEHLRAAEQEHKAGVAQLAENAAKAKEIAAQLPANLATLYDRLRRKFKTGPLLAEAVDGNCSGCDMAFRLAFWQQVKADPDRLWTCEECGRIIVYNPPVMQA